MTAAKTDSIASVTAGFYRDADPTVAADALTFALEAGEYKKNPTLLLMFARMAEAYPEVNAWFRRLLSPSLDAEWRQVIQLLLEPPDQLKGAGYLLTAIGNPQNLDLFWCEFLVTGTLEAVKRIVAVLDWKDLTRSLIDEALLLRSGGVELSEYQWQSFRQLGILIGSTDAVRHPHVAVPGDVDLLIWHGIQEKHEASVALVRQFRQDHLVHMATKGAALWSLRSNAEQHPSVKELCEAEAGVAGGVGRQYLRQPWETFSWLRDA